MNRAFVFAAGLLAACHANAPITSPFDAAVTSVPAAAEPAVEEEAAAEGEFAADALRPCTAETGGLDEANAALRLMTHQIQALDDGPNAATQPVLAALEALFKTPCFELAAADLPDELVFDSGRALKTWWSVEAAYGIGRYLEGHRQLESVITPAAPRTTFFLEGHESHPLAPLLCRSNDVSCGLGEAAAWYQRVDHDLAQRTPNKDAELEKCAEEARASEVPQRWTTFRTCRVHHTPTRSVLPLGRFRAPTDGIFALAEGHGCFHLTLFDLASGAVYRASCNGVKTETGRVSVSVLREAVWNLALSGVAKEGHRINDHVQVPPDIPTGRPREDEREIGIGIGNVSTSSWRREWSWLRPTKKGGLVGQVSGEVYAAPSSDANHYASTLLEAVATSFVPGCAPSLPPSTRAAIDWSRPGRRAYHPDVDAAFAFDQPDLAAARAAVTTAKMPQICAAIP